MNTIVQHTGDKGKGLFLTEPAPAGSIVIIEQPTISWPIRKHAKNTCAVCMKFSRNDRMPCFCAGCYQIFYCDETCAVAHQEKGHHNSHICQCYVDLSQLDINDDIHSTIVFIIELVKLRQTNLSQFEAVCSQSNVNMHLSEDEEKACKLALDIIVSNISLESIPELSIVWLQDVVKADKSCGLAITVPSCLRDIGEIDENRKAAVGGSQPVKQKPDGDGDDACVGAGGAGGERDEEANEVTVADIVRGYSVCPNIAMSNHSCLPTCIRWDNADYVDAVSGGKENSSLKLCLRALYDLPAGTELTQSYTPIQWSYPERQEYCKDIFGFSCCCERCTLESQYDFDNDDDSDEDNDEDHDDNDRELLVNGSTTGTSAIAAAVEEANNDEGDDDCSDGDWEDVENDESGDDDGGTGDGGAFTVNEQYINLYLLRHSCEVPRCTGTLTPCIDFNSNPSKSKPTAKAKTKPMKQQTEAALGTKDYYECNVCYSRRTHASFIDLVVNGPAAGASEE